MAFVEGSHGGNERDPGAGLTSRRGPLSNLTPRAGDEHPATPDQAKVCSAVGYSPALTERTYSRIASSA